MAGSQVKVEENDLPEVSSTFHPAFHSYVVPNSHIMLPPMSASGVSQGPFEDVHGFSAQFLNSSDLSYPMLALSPISAVDPCLRGYHGEAPSPSPGRTHLGLSGRGFMQPSLMFGSPERQRRSYEIGGQGVHRAEGPTSSGEAAAAAPAPVRATQTRRATKRYQYWTAAEDDLVFSLRQRYGWTWKEISGELQRRLGGVHTWQAVQMRYLRTRKNREPLEAAVVRRVPRSAKPSDPCMGNFRHPGGEAGGDAGSEAGEEPGSEPGSEAGSEAGKVGGKGANRGANRAANHTSNRTANRDTNRDTNHTANRTGSGPGGPSGPGGVSQLGLPPNSIQYHTTAGRLERAIQEDWQERWARVGARAGIELDSRTARQALANSKLPTVYHYIE